MTTQQHSCRTRRVSALPGSRIERFCARPYDVAVGYARRRLHAAARMVPWLVASVTMRVAALCGTLMRVPAVVLDVERLELHRRRFWRRCAGCNCRGASQCARPSTRALVGAPPRANAPSNRTTEICRRVSSRRMSRGRAPPVPPNLAAAPQSSQIRLQRQARKQNGGTAQLHIVPHPAAVVQEYIIS